MIARRRQEHGNRARHRDRVQDRHVAVAVDDDDVARRDVGVPDHLVRRRRAVGDEEAVVGVEDPRRVALGGGDRARVVEQLAQLVDRVADVGAQHVLAEELVEHLPDRALQERDAARVARAVPRVRAVLRVVDERAEERRRERVEVALDLADDVPGDELRRVLEHVDEAVQLAQHVVRDVARRARLAVEVDRDLGVLEPDLLDELAQVEHRRIELGSRRELLVVDRQDERRRAALLLRELREVAVARDAQHLHAFLLDRRGERADAEARGVLGAEVLVDDDDRKAEFHGARPLGWTPRGRRAVAGPAPPPGIPGRQVGKARIMGRFAPGGYENARRSTHVRCSAATPERAKRARARGRPARAGRSRGPTLASASTGSG